MHHERPLRGSGRRRRSLLLLVKLVASSQYVLRKLLLPHVPLVRAVERALARCLVQHLRANYTGTAQPSARREPTPVATFMMCGLSCTMTYTSLVAATWLRSTGAKPARAVKQGRRRRRRRQQQRTAAHRVEIVTSDELLPLSKRHRQRVDEQRAVVDNVDAADVARDIRGYAPQRDGAKQDNAGAEHRVSGGKWGGAA